MDDFLETTLTREQLELRRAAASARHAAPVPRSNPQLRLHVLASGSKGNCSVVEHIASGACVVVDCGITKRAFMERCKECGVDTARIEAVLVTHEHTDHTKGLGVVLRGLAKLGVEPTLYASAAVHAASPELQALEDAHGLQHFASGDDLALAEMAVHAFPTLHDAAESFGFRFDAGADSLGFMTDTGIVTGEAHESLQGCHVLAIETNHDLRMLRNGPYPRFLQERIASRRGHLSNMQAADLLEELLCNELEQVVGMHVSENNNTYDLPHDALADVLRRNTHPAQASVGKQRTPLSVV